VDSLQRIAARPAGKLSGSEINVRHHRWRYGLEELSTEARDFQSAARLLGLSVVIVDVAAEGSIEAAFGKLVELRVGALLLGANILWQQRRTEIALLAAGHAMPTMFWESISVQAGALSSYGPDLPDSFRQVGAYAGRILKGEKPADLPVIQPTKFELVLNLETARTLKLEIPTLLLAIADRVIE
jgi:putative tryptophan/tyrosine transport system substrate-binding protein